MQKGQPERLGRKRDEAEQLKRKMAAEDEEKETRKKAAEEKDEAEKTLVSVSEDESSLPPPPGALKLEARKNLAWKPKEDDDDDTSFDNTDWGKGLHRAPRGSRQPDRPRLAQDRTYRFMSIGRKTTRGQDFWGFLSKNHGLEKLNTVVVNVENLSHVKDEVSQEHCGLHADIWETVVRVSAQELEDAWVEMARKINNYVDEDEEEVNVIFQCTWGKHRSVAAAEITKLMVEDEPRTKTWTEHLAKKNWGRWKCGRCSCRCHAMNDKKQDVLEHARAIWKKVWG